MRLDRILEDNEPLHAERVARYAEETKNRIEPVRQRAANDNAKIPWGETAARQINADWKGAPCNAACSAAFRYGELESANGLGYSRAEQLLESNFALRGVHQSQWQFVWQSYLDGRAETVDRVELKRRYQSPIARDRFQVTWFDDVNKSVTKEEVVKGVLGAGEFSDLIGQPGTAKSVLAVDIGCHIAAGMDWHGRKVKPGLVVFVATERKPLTERRIAAWRKQHDASNIPFVVIGGKLDLTTSPVNSTRSVAVNAKWLSDRPCFRKHGVLRTLLEY